MSTKEQCISCKHLQQSENSFRCDVFSKEILYDGTVCAYHEAMNGDEESDKQEINVPIHGIDDLPEQLPVAPSNMTLGIIGGVVAAIVGAAVWAAITFYTEKQYGIIAIGVGALVGFVVRYLGKGRTIQFGIIGATLALVACILGDYLSTVAFYAQFDDAGFFETLAAIDQQYFFEIAFEGFDAISAVFYALAVYEGYKFSIIKDQQ